MGTVSNMVRKNGTPRDIRRMTGLEHAASILGGQEALATALGISARAVRKKMAASSPVGDVELRLTAAALVNRARQATDLANRLTSIIIEQGDS